MSDNSNYNSHGSNSDVVDLENGHYTSDSDSDSTATFVEDDDCENSEVGDFDTNLPTTHQYLGKLENVGGYTLYDEGQIISSMLAIHTSTLAFPGFTLPLVISHYSSEIQVFDDIKNGCTFALVCANKNKTSIYDYGVIMEVFETCTRRGTLNLKAKGRQRCHILTRIHHPLWGRTQRVTVRILGEPNIKSPVNDTQLQTLKMRRCQFSNDYVSLKKCYKYRRYHLSQFPHPSWVYDHNELAYYVHYITKKLSKFYAKENIPQDPVVLSYWFAQNFQLAHSERLDLLKCNSVLERFRMEQRFLHLKRLLICGKCSVEIANQNDVFIMSKEGVQNNYCSPGGQVYETVTVTFAKNIVMVGEPSRQFSWFPGYAWTILQCQNCGGHLGWLFTSKSHNPAKFYGLANNCLEIEITDKVFKKFIH